MPIDKFEKPRLTDTDPSSISLDINYRRVICCSECGESKFTLKRVLDDKGKKVKPAKYICVECLKK